MIVPGTARLAFKITLNSEDANRTVVQNLGRAIVKKTTIKISGNEVMSLDDSDVYHCYNDLWKAEQEGRMPSTKVLTSLTTETQQESELVLEKGCICCRRQGHCRYL